MEAMPIKNIVGDSEQISLKLETRAGTVGKSRKRKSPARNGVESARGQKVAKREEQGKGQREDTFQTAGKEGAISAAKRRAERKAEKRDILTRAREKWEQLRPKATAKDKAVKLCDELYKDLRGRTREFAFRPDGSRILQWLLSSSSPSTRSAVLEELLDNSTNSESEVDGNGGLSNTPFFAKLLTDRYAKHLAIKLLRIVPVPKRAEILELQVIPLVGSLARTTPGATALDIAYTTLLNGPSRSRLVLGVLFSKQPVHWKEVQQRWEELPVKNTTNSGMSSNFSRAVEYVPKEFRNVILDSAYETASQLVEKEELLSLELVHAVLREWLEVSMVDGQVDDIRALSSALAIHLGRLCHTRAGMSVSLKVIKILDAKHRKKAVRSLSGLVRKMVMDDFGHRVILGLMEWTDDTRLVGQLLVGELLKRSTKAGTVSDVKVEAENGQTEGPGGHGERKRGGRSKAEKKGREIKKESKLSSQSEEGTFDTEFLVKLCEHKNGRMILLNLLFGHDSRYFNPEVYGMVWEGIDEEKFGKTSKKDGRVRRQELLGYAEEGIKAVVLEHSSCLLKNVRASPVMIGAASHEGTSDAVIHAVKEIFEKDKAKEVCKSASTRRALGAVFKVSNDVAAAVIAALGSSTVQTLANVDGGMSVAKHLAHGSGDVKAIALLEQIDLNAVSGKEDT